jgi:hypothetical protein
VERQIEKQNQPSESQRQAHVVNNNQLSNHCTTNAKALEENCRLPVNRLAKRDDDDTRSCLAQTEKTPVCAPFFFSPALPAALPLSAAFPF